MTNQPEPNLQRLHELLAERAAWELAPEEEAELAKLLAGVAVDPETYELVAAQTVLGLHCGQLDPLPDQLRERIISAALAEFAPAREGSAKQLVVRAEPKQAPKIRLGYRELLAWGAAAACLAIAVSMVWRNKTAPEVSYAAARERLLTTDPNAVQAKWTDAGDPSAKNTTGDVVWSNSEQRGYMRFKGLAANDPSKDEYQLWIFDAEQDPRYPIDGGVFDIGPATADAKTGDTIVPIHAKLHVVAPKMFAVTVEKPGGVVVSSRKRIAVLAKVAAMGG